MKHTTTAEHAETPAVQTALVPVEQRAVLALNSTETEKHLMELATKHSELTIIKNKAGRDQVHSAAMELLKARTAIKDVSKTAREDATKFSKAVIAEENRLIAITSAEEERLFKLRDEWDAEQERIRQEKIRAEQLRVEAINAEIDDISVIPMKVANESASVVEAELRYWMAREIDEQVFQEFTDKAKYVLGETISRLTEYLAAAKAREEEAKRIAEEQAHIAEENAKLAAERAELDRQRRELEEATARAAAEAAVVAQRALDEANAKARREAAEREAFMKAQQDAFEEEKREAEEKWKAEKEKLSAERAEIARKVAEQEAKELAEKAAKELAERNAELEKQEAARKARDDEELENAQELVRTIASLYEISDDEAEERIIRAAATLTANQEVTA